MVKVLQHHNTKCHKIWVNYKNLAKVCKHLLNPHVKRHFKNWLPSKTQGVATTN